MTISVNIWGIASGAAAVAVLAGGWFVGVQPQLTAAADLSQTAMTVDTQNQATMIKLAGLTKAAARLDVMQAHNAVLLKSVPTILKPNTFIRRVSEVAALDGVDVSAITPGDAIAYTPPVASSVTAGAKPAPVLATTSPLITGANLTVVPVNVVVVGDADDVLQFTHDIQSDERTFSISGVQTSASDSSAGTSASLTGYIYTLKR